MQPCQLVAGISERRYGLSTRDRKRSIERGRSRRGIEGAVMPGRRVSVRELSRPGPRTYRLSEGEF